MAYQKNKDENYQNRGGINEKSSKYLTQKGQFEDIRNYGFEKVDAFVSRPGYEASASLPISTYKVTPYGMVQYRKDDGFSQIIFDSGPTLFALNPNLISIGSTLSLHATVGYPIDFQIGNNVLYYANGYSFQRFDGSYSCFYNIPPQRSFMLAPGLTFNTSLASLGSTVVLAAGHYQFKYAYKRGTQQTEGIVGLRTPDDQDVGISVPYADCSLSATLVVTQGQWVVFGFTVPPGHGISSIVPYVDLPAAGTSYIAGPTAANFFLTTYTGITLYTAEFSPFSTAADYQNQFQFTLVPTYLEMYKNMLFMAGFSSEPSTVYFSEIAQFENLDEENFFEVRTGNADIITNLTLFQDNIIIFKNKSIHALSGDSPETLSLKDMNLNYGCVNNTASVVWENKLWFMDSKGICNFNGPDTAIVSYAVEERLNTVDKSKCRAFYIKKRSEVWFCCGNICFVYDHDVNAWTIYDNIPIEFSKASQIIEYTDGSKDLTFFNNTNGSSYIHMNRFDDDLYTDMGQPITLIAKTRFHVRDNHTTQEMWRRLFFNSNVTGTTTFATLLFRQDYGSSVVYSQNIPLNQFQTRIDFGISARALQVEMIIQASEKITFNGYTIESRYLRSV